MIRPGEPLGDYRLDPPDEQDDERAVNDWADEWEDEIETWHAAWTALRKSYRERFVDILTSGELEDAWARIDARNKARKAKKK